MKTLPLNSRPLTASQYLAKHEHARNVKANRRSDLLCAAYCFTLKAIAASALCVAGGGIIQLAILLSK